MICTHVGWEKSAHSVGTHECWKDLSKVQALSGFKCNEDDVHLVFGLLYKSTGKAC